MTTKTRSCAILCLSALTSAALACFGKNDRPAATTGAPPPTTQRSSTPAPPPREAPVAQPSTEDTDDSTLTNFRDPDNIFGRTLDEINADSPLADIRFDFDSAVLLDSAKATLDHHADWLKRYPSVTLLVEGHCDERGTVEYNLALGERRSTVAYNYLMSLGIPATRLKTISYGKEFPADPGHTEEAWARNRRAHFQITAK
jgi:peptidoglycan-associated lipoprotein